MTFVATLGISDIASRNFISTTMARTHAYVRAFFPGGDFQG